MATVVYAGRHGDSARATRTWRQRGALAAVIAVAAVLLGAAGWLATGGKWFIVATPSMGTEAPVGTLLWVRPVDPTTLRVGDFITFRPPGRSETFSHRIVSITPAGIRTKGAITSPDPWTLRPSDVVGRVVLRWWAVGWLVRALPILLVGGLVGWLARRRLRGDWRTAAGMVVMALTVCAVLVIQRPLTNAQLLGSRLEGSNGHATYVSTGLLPIKLSAAGVSDVELAPGAHGTIVADAAHRFQVTVGPAVSWWVWAMIGLFGAAPGLLTSRRRGVDAVDEAAA